jgi:O-6-methylguanine DNA methyltransferase
LQRQIAPFPPLLVEWKGGRICLSPSSAFAVDPLFPWIDWLAAYAAKRPLPFPSRLPPGTPFQHAVWTALIAIPFGSTRSYGDIADAIGSPRGARAVGAACKANPWPLLIPCHRAIGATGRLTGFSAGGGIATKEALLTFERG